MGFYGKITSVSYDNLHSYNSNHGNVKQYILGSHLEIILGHNKIKELSFYYSNTNATEATLTSNRVIHSQYGLHTLLSEQ